MTEDEIDITDDLTEAGDLDQIISILTRFRKEGFNRLYWDGYNSSIALYKSKEKDD